MPSSRENSGLVGINLSKMLKEHNFPGHPAIISHVWSLLYSSLHVPHTELQRVIFCLSVGG